MARAEVHKLMERMAIPAIAAPMFLVSNPALTLACCGEGIMGSFPAHGTRSREELAAAWERDPLQRLGERLSPGERAKLDAAAADRVQAAIDAALAQEPQSGAEFVEQARWQTV